MEKKEPSYTFGGNIIWYSQYGEQYQGPLKTEIGLLCDPAIPLLGIYLEKTIIRRDRRTPEFTAVLFTLARTWKQPRRPSAEGWVKIWNIDTMECYSAIKRTR